jgi:hypothetical protein
MRQAIAPIVFGLLACASNPYGYAPQYAPLSEEEDYIERAQEPSYEDVRRNPAEFDGMLIGWFAVVQKVEPGDGAGQYRVTADLRFHQERHLCSDQFDDSCRVTVSQRSGGPFTALVALPPEDASGKFRVGPSSLLKVYGKATHDYDAQGGPILRIEYYRHWPPGNYVSTGGRASMRQ